MADASSTEQFVRLVILGLPGDDALQDVGQVGNRLNAVELARLDQGVGDRPTMGSSVGTGE
jgi:hypothetical protein